MIKHNSLVYFLDIYTRQIIVYTLLILHSSNYIKLQIGTAANTLAFTSA